MGLFDFVAGKKKKDDAPTKPLSPWQQSLQQAGHRHGFAWRDDNRHGRDFVWSLLEQAAPSFGKGKIVEGTRPEICSSEDILIDPFGGGSIFIRGPGKSTCPNCGAPAEQQLRSGNEQ
jgi:hypothetical protein